MIQSSFGFIAELRRKYRVPVYPCPHKHTTFSVVNILHFSGPFVKIDEPTLTHHYHPKSMVCIRVHPCIYSVGFDKCIMTYIYHYNIIQNSFTPLKILYFACSSLPPLFSSKQPLMFLVFIDFPFAECHALGVLQYVVFLDWLLSLF